MMKRTALTQEQLREVLKYNKRTGLFTWRLPRKNVRVGEVAGDFSGRYVRIKLDQKSYAASCLAWLYVTGEWPPFEVDHRDTDKHNNRWKNLRSATRAQNAHNTRPMKRKKYTALKGVTWAKGRRKWMAAIRVEGRSTTIGYFDSDREAHIAYAVKARVLRGEFARTQ